MFCALRSPLMRGCCSSNQLRHAGPILKGLNVRFYCDSNSEFRKKIYEAREAALSVYYTPDDPINRFNSNDEEKIRKIVNAYHLVLNGPNATPPFHESFRINPSRKVPVTLGELGHGSIREFDPEGFAELEGKYLRRREERDLLPYAGDEVKIVLASTPEEATQVSDAFFEQMRSWPENASPSDEEKN